jgi:hypothetical protein
VLQHFEALVHPALLTHPNPQRVLIVSQNDNHDDSVLCEVLKHATAQHIQVLHLTRARALKEAHIHVLSDSFVAMNRRHRHETALDRKLHHEVPQKPPVNQSCRKDPRVAMTYVGDQTPRLVPTNVDGPLDVVLVEQLYVLVCAWCYCFTPAHCFAPCSPHAQKSMEYGVAHGRVSSLLFPCLGQGWYLGWTNRQHCADGTHKHAQDGPLICFSGPTARTSRV